MLVTNETHETCHSCAKYREQFDISHPFEDVEIEVSHKGFAGILHFWWALHSVSPERIISPEEAREINR